MPQKKFHPTPHPQDAQTVSFFRSPLDEEPYATTWEAIVTMMQTDAALKQSTESLRAVLEMGDKTAYSSLKRQLPCVSPAALCLHGHKQQHVQHLTGISMVDFDGIESPEALHQALWILSNDPHTFLLHTTPSGKGLRVLFRYTCEGPEVAYLDAWRYGNEYFHLLTGLDYDPATKDPTRLSFLCHDPQCCHNPAAVSFDLLQHSSEEAATERQYAAHTPDPDSLIARAESLMERKGYTFQPSQRHTYLLNISIYLVLYGIDQEAAERYAIGRMGEAEAAEARQAVRWAYSTFAANWGDWAPRNQQESRQQPPAAGKKAKGNKEPKRPTEATTASVSSLEDYLGAAQVRYNEIADCIEIVNPASGQYEALTDRLSNSLWLHCIDHVGKYVKPQDFEKVLHSGVIPTYNPFRDYFDSLPSWDGSDHLGSLAATVHLQHVDEELLHPWSLGADALFQYCFRKWMVGMVASWLDPQVTNQVILTLIGSQGLFKSTFFRKLMPPELSRYFLAKGNSTYVSKDDKIAVSSYGLIDFEEIDTMRDSDLNAVKALVTTEVIAERAAYARNRENRHHLASFCATGNNQTFLTDMTGNRRWLPFLVEGIDSPYSHPINYPQLYAQARQLLEEGFQYWFSRKEDLIIEHYKGLFIEVTPEEELLRYYYRKPRRQPNGEMEKGLFLTATAITTHCSLGMRIPTLSPKKMGIVLTHLGFGTKTIHGRKGYIVVERPLQELETDRFQHIHQVR